MKTIKHMLFTFLCMVFMIAIFSQPVAAQATLSYAELNGTIQDPSEQVIVGATVAIRNMGTNREYNAISSNSGTYILPNLPPGQYELMFHIPDSTNTRALWNSVWARLQQSNAEHCGHRAGGNRHRHSSLN